MKISFLFASILMLVAAGCHHPGAAKLRGRWDLQSDDKLRSLGEGRMSLVFYGNGKLETMTDFPMARSKKSGRWSIQSFDESSQTVVVDCQLNGEQVNTEIRFLDDHRIKLVPPNMAATNKQLVFLRNRENE